MRIAGVEKNLQIFELTRSMSCGNYQQISLFALRHSIDSLPVRLVKDSPEFSYAAVLNMNHKLLNRLGVMALDTLKHLPADLLFYYLHDLHNYQLFM